MEQKNCGLDRDFSALVKNHVKVLAESIKITNSIPVGCARNNFVTCFPDFNDEIKPFSDQLENMMSTVLRNEGFRNDMRVLNNEEKVDLVVDGVNRILERVKRNIDEINGTKPPSAPVESTPKTNQEGQGSWNQPTNSSFTRELWVKRRPTNMPRVAVKPQIYFRERVDNSESPFKPRLTEKPNSMKPLNLRLEKGPDGVARYAHPYQYELEMLSTMVRSLGKVKPQVPWDVSLKPEIYVDTKAALKAMVNDLKKQTEIAVDLEHHDFHSFQGFTCLMQISTRKDDYIIDTLALRSDLIMLNEVFTDPEIVKVFHGAEWDVEWLQKDLSLYVVNMFDTFYGSLEMNFRRLGLAYLLDHYCNIKTDKAYQLYDWRIRPLSKIAQAYARSDTHYLLYIYDRLRNDLIDKDNGSTSLLNSVYQRAIDVCKRRYEKPVADYLLMYKESKRVLDNRQLHAFKNLYNWRDEIARKEDESYRFVLPNHMLWRLSEMLPQDKNAILACCVPTPLFVRRQLNRIYDIITEARKQPLNTSETQHFINSLAIRNTTPLNKLNNPHDFSYQDDFRDNLPTLLGDSDVIDVSKPENKCKISVFDDDSMNFVQRPAVKFVSPYVRFKRTTEFILAEEEKLREEETKEEEEIRYIPKEERLRDIPKEEHVDVKIEEEPVAEPEKELPKTPDKKSTKRKLETLSEQIPDKKATKCYETAKTIADADKPECKNEIDDFPKLECDQNETIVQNRKTDNIRKNNPKKLKKVEKTKSDFVAYDYSAGNYKKFSTGARQNVKQLLSSKITFGANKKKNRKNFRPNATNVGKAKK